MRFFTQNESYSVDENWEFIKLNLNNIMDRNIPKKVIKKMTSLG